LERLEVKRGDVVLVEVPSELGRPRPGVVVQADGFNEELSTVIVCPISSNLQDRLPLRPIIEAKPSNGLRLRSQIMTDKMIALRHDRVRRVIGHIDKDTSEQLDRALLVVPRAGAVTKLSPPLSAYSPPPNLIRVGG
jgi:mRNA interferase MazF